jgi:hypothetical protein
MWIEPINKSMGYLVTLVSGLKNEGEGMKKAKMTIFASFIFINFNL